METELRGWDNSYERIGRKHGSVFYRLEIYTRGESAMVHEVPLGISAREDINKDLIRETLARWNEAHDETVSTWRVTESMTCAAGGVDELPEIAPGIEDSSLNHEKYPGPYPSREGERFEELDIDVAEGDTITYEPGGNASVYGTKSATVLDVAPGPAGEEPSLLVRSDSGETKIRAEWIVSVSA